MKFFMNKFLCLSLCLIAPLLAIDQDIEKKRIIANIKSVWQDLEDFGLETALYNCDLFIFDSFITQFEVQCYLNLKNQIIMLYMLSPSDQDLR